VVQCGNEAVGPVRLWGREAGVVRCGAVRLWCH
jgi:hypothetical protein